MPTPDSAPIEQNMRVLGKERSRGQGPGECFCGACRVNSELSFSLFGLFSVGMNAFLHEGIALVDRY